MYYEDLALGWQFNGEGLAILCFALVLWLLGGLTIFLGARKKWHPGYVVGLISLWIVGSGYNLFWLAMMSL